ncbi:chymotrypsin-like elastase family member 1 [Pomacea canaliculata]|uniref:chymotrypsin-like elastase family member 1 n=1 Tax=Pomacea canaliculata TaxID=400727 RepID=UPI000D73615E|nr:chymotrypsin-like elastase family member 1 [Pomacea canaliculata]
MVALKIQMSDQTNSRTYCGAVMLTSQWLVTAALCVFPFVTFASTDLAVVIGDKVVSAPDQDEQTIGVANFYIHPRFNSSTGSNDLALIRLQYPATLSNCVQPLRRYTETACYTAISDCVITGWGPWDENNVYSNSLWPNSGDVKVLDEVVTRLTARSVFQRSAPEGALFALPNNNFVKACVFDWGGMTACLKNGEWLLRGVIAQDNCFVESQPIVITNIDRYKSWIDTCIYNSNACQSL